MMLEENSWERAFFVVFGGVFTAVAAVATIATIFGNSHPTGLLIGPLLLAAGGYVIWMGLTWFSDGQDGRIGGGPFVTFALQPGEYVVKAVPAVFRETTKRPFGSVGAAFENNIGRLYLTDRRLIFCPSRFRPDQRAVSIAYRHVREVDDNPPWQMNFAKAGVTLTLDRGEAVAIWCKDQGIVEQLRAQRTDLAIPNNVPTDVGHIHKSVVLLAIGWTVAWCSAMTALVLSVETPPAIIGFFVLCFLVGMVGFARLVLKYMRQVRGTTTNSIS
jgi:hypothetical protein